MPGLKLKHDSERGPRWFFLIKWLTHFSRKQIYKTHGLRYTWFPMAVRLICSLGSNFWILRFVTLSGFVTTKVEIRDWYRNLWRKLSQFVTTSKCAFSRPIWILFAWICCSFDLHSRIGCLLIAALLIWRQQLLHTCTTYYARIILAYKQCENDSKLTWSQIGTKSQIATVKCSNLAMCNCPHLWGFKAQPLRLMSKVCGSILLRT